MLYRLATPERSIGKTMAFHGNFGVLVRALAYIRSLGAEGLRAISDNAVINAEEEDRYAPDVYARIVRRLLEPQAARSVAT